MVTAPDIPGHRVGGVLGAGGFATVYRCWQLAVGREVAVKIDNRVLFTERDRRRFLREVTAAGRLSGHPHVIDVYDAGTLGDGRPYMVMELCPAGSLSDALRRNGPMPPGQVRDIGVRLADALAAAHASGVLHRDIKPANILVNRFGVVGLSDFGLASIISAHGDQTASREALTPAYSSPETFRGEEPTVLADVYSLAATLYALLSGHPPHFTPGEKAPGFVTIMRMHGEPVQDAPGAPPELMALLRAAMSPDPAARPQSAAALRDALADPRGQIPAATGYVQAWSPPAGQHLASGGQNPRSGPASGYGPASRQNPAPGREGAPGYGPAPGQPWPDQRTGPGADDGGPTTSGRHRQGGGEPTEGKRTPVRRPAWQAGLLGAGLVAVIAAAVLVGARFFGPGPAAGAGHGASAGAAPDQSSASAATTTASVYGVATTGAGCPAAAVRGAVARCPAQPECFNGLVVISGSATAAPLPCGRSHYWQTFAIAILPAGLQTYSQPQVAADPTVRKVCSQAVMLASRSGQARRLPAADWEIQVLPPSEATYDSGARAYRCLATQIGHQPAVSQFGR
ncbi:MAG TPA: protein kinase [Streptosporangiaceae bacterium]|nr:protein kinase [Streptosporangiaceae bacterium]